MKYYFSALIILFLVACKSGTGKTPMSDTAVATSDVINTGGKNLDSSSAPGAKLIAVNDCLTCHKINQTSIGPSYKQIAAKYALNEGNVENLAGRIINGATGLWGKNKMTPHRNLSEPDAQNMARYILSLKDSM